MNQSIPPPNPLKPPPNLSPYEMKYRNSRMAEQAVAYEQQKARVPFTDDTSPLGPKHVQKAREICLDNVTKKYLTKILKGKPCKACQGKASLGLDDLGMLLPCDRCVNVFQVQVDWLDYADKHPELHQYYKESLKKHREWRIRHPKEKS